MFLIYTRVATAAAASLLGLSISALSPNAEVALAIGPCVMVLNIMLGDASARSRRFRNRSRRYPNFPSSDTR